MLQKNNHNKGRIFTFISMMILVLLTACFISGCITNEPTKEGENASNTEAIELEADESTYEPTQEEIIDEAITQKLSSMSLQDKVSQMVITRPEDITNADYSFTADGKTNLSSYPFGGICYFGKNLSTPGTLRAYIIGFQQAMENTTSKIPMFITIDEEGGGIQYPDATTNTGLESGITRLVEAGFPDTKALYPMFYYKDQGEETAYDNAAAIAKYLTYYDFNWDFAPVADTNSNPNNPIIGYRAYSNDYEQCASLVAAAVKGYEDNNMACALKHFPGHGDTTTDTHKGVAVIDNKDLDQLMSSELLPFIAGIEAGADSVMMGHITVSAVDSLPASLSYQWISVILRQTLGFDGVVVTDGLGMGALTNEWSGKEIAVMSVSAGCDVLLLPEDPYAAVDAIVEAVGNGTLDETRIDESVRRILNMKARHGIWQFDGENVGESAAIE